MRKRAETRNQYTGFKRIAASLMMLVGFAGCAALTIDVDVYKGPLANHEDVQIQQITVMAVGAKPLLVQLRDKLELTRNGKFGHLDDDNQLDIDYKSGFMNPRRYPFRNIQARRVNNILSLYEDRESDEMKVLLQEVRTTLDNYHRALKILLPKNKEQMKDDWERYEKAFATPLSKEDKSKPNGGSQNISEDHFEKLKTAYKKFIYPQTLVSGELSDKQYLRQVHDIFTVHDQLYNFLNSSGRVYGITTLSPETVLGRKDCKNPDEEKNNLDALMRNDSEIQGQKPEEKAADNNGNKPEDVTTIEVFKGQIKEILENKIKEIEKSDGSSDTVHLDELKTLKEFLEKALLALEIGPQKQPREEIVKVIDNYLGKENAVARNKFNQLVKLIDGKKPEESGKEPDNCTNAKFKALAKNKDLVTKHADLLFKDGERELKDEFIKDVITAAQSFLDVRKALSHLTRLSLQIIILLDSPEYEKWKKKHLGNIIEIFSDYIEPKRLLDALNLKPASFRSECKVPEINDPAPGDSEGNSSDELNSCLVQGFNEFKAKIEPASPMQSLTEGEEIKINEEVKKRLKANPTLYAMIFLKLDSLMREDANEELSLVSKGTSKKPEKLKYLYGLSAGPIMWRQSTPKFNFGAQRSATSLKTIMTDLIGGALAKGRLNDGLETMIENYLKTADQWKANTADVGMDKNRLLDALVRYATKILFIGNFNSLLGDEERAPAGKEDHTTGVKHWYNGHLGSTAKPYGTDIDSYVRLLQAVGNSILSQVDELRHQSDYAKNLDENGSRELRGLALSLPGYSPQVLEKLIASLRADALASDQDIIEAENLKRLQISLENWEKKAGVHTRFVTIKKLIKEPDNIIKEINKDIDNSTSPDITKIKGTFITELSKKIEEGKKPDNLLNPDHQKKLAVLKDFFEKTLPTAAINPDAKTKDEVFSSIKEYLTNEEKASKKDLDDAITKFNQLAELEDEDKKNSLDEAKLFFEGKIKSEKFKRILAYELVKDNKFKIIEEVEKKGPVLTLDPKTVNAALKKVLSTVEKPSSMNKNPSYQEWIEEKKNLKDAKKIVADRLAQTEFPFEIPPQEFPNAKEVMDQLIAAWKYELLEAVRQGGPESGTVKKLTSALEAAYEQRSGLIYIRPAFAYLRNSYPATSLQEDASLGWKNMLTDNMFRSIPIFGGLTQNEKERKIAEINQEIDKQFWQNINRVKVTGGGNTNYVIAKDDLGNWYVKNYSANPEDIIQSARNLMMFGMGGGIANLPDAAKKATDTPGKAKDAAEQTEDAVREVQAPPTVLERQFNKFKGRYDEASNKAYDDINALVNSLEADIEKNWEKDTVVKNDASKLKEVMTKSAETHLAEVKIKKEALDKDKVVPADEIIATLRAIKHFKKGLTAGIGKLEGLGDPSKKQSKEIVDTTVSGKLGTFIEERERAVKNFETAIIFIGESVSPDEKK